MKLYIDTSCNMFWSLTVYLNGEVYISRDAKWRDDVCFDVDCEKGDRIGIEGVVVSELDMDDDLVSEEKAIRESIMEEKEEEGNQGNDMDTNPDENESKWEPECMHIPDYDYPYITEFVVEDTHDIIQVKLNKLQHQAGDDIYNEIAFLKIYFLDAYGQNGNSVVRKLYTRACCKGMELERNYRDIRKIAWTWGLGIIFIFVVFGIACFWWADRRVEKTGYQMDFRTPAIVGVGAFALAILAVRHFFIFPWKEYHFLRDNPEIPFANNYM